MYAICPAYALEGTVTDDRVTVAPEFSFSGALMYPAGMRVITFFDGLDYNTMAACDLIIAPTELDCLRVLLRGTPARDSELSAYERDTYAPEDVPAYDTTTPQIGN